jgi:16S rRNA processing protein RimM
MSAAPADSLSEPRWPADAVEVARIGEAWGVKGWFKVVPFAADPQAVFASRRWYLRAPPDDAATRQIPHWDGDQLKIGDVRTHADSVVAHALGVDTREGAEALRGARVFVPRSSFPTAHADEYYWVDLIGLAVVNRSGEHLGTVQGLIDNGPQSVLRVAAAPDAGVAPAGNRPEHLIPFVAAYVDEVSIERKCIMVDWERDY